MPSHVKFLLSRSSLSMAFGGYRFMVHLGQTGPSYAVALLGVVAVFAMWVFPEFSKENTALLK